MEYTMDDFNKGILSERQRARTSRSGIMQGDFIRSGDKLARVTHVWQGDGIPTDKETAQTTVFSDDGEGGSFYLSASGGCSYSGSLESGVRIDHLKDTGETREGRCWFFHHGISGGGRGVSATVRCRVWELLTDDKAVDKSKPARYLVAADASERKGGIYSATYTTFDGVERVQYRDGQTLADYLAQFPERMAISEAEYDKQLEAYHESLVTLPQHGQCSEEHFTDMLECLPPCRWSKYGGVEAFHISERLTGNLVQWCARVEDSNGVRCYSFTDFADINSGALAEKLKGL